MVCGAGGMQPTLRLMTPALTFVCLACGGPLEGDAALAPPELESTAQAIVRGDFVDPGSGTIGPAPSAALAVPDATPHGSMTVVTPNPQQIALSKRNVWAPVPGISTVVRSRAGDNLAITASLEVLGSNTYTYVRAVVDGVPAQPGSVSFKDPESFDGVRSFTFVVPGVTEGQHVVTLEAHTGNVVTEFRGRTMTVRSASPTTGSTRLAVAAGAEGNPVSMFGSWTTIPGLTASITTDATRNFVIHFSGDVYTTGRFFVRAVLDGAVLQDALFATNNAHSGARSYSFVANNVAPGAHSVRIEGYGEGSPALVYARTMAVSAAPTSFDGGSGAVATERAAVSYGSAWTTVTEHAFITTLPNNSLAITVGGHVYGSGRLSARVLLNDVVVGAGPVTLGESRNAWRGTAYTFVATNVPLGLHRLTFQVSSQGTSYLADYFLTNEYRARAATDLMKPYLSMSPRHQRPAALVICFDPMRPAHAPPARAYLGEMIEGAGASLSVPAWLGENGGDLTRFSSVRWSGCEDGAWHVADPAKQGDYYWNNNAFEEMWRDALRKADPGVDFHAYDVDADGRITPDELVVMIVRPQTSAYGTIRSTTLGLDGGSSLTVTLADLYLGADPGRRRLNVGLTAHELSHAMLGALDLHSCASTTRPGTASIMDNHVEATLLDPLHRLKFGYAVPSMVDIPSSATMSGVVLPAAALSRQLVLLTDRARGDREYFVLDYRRANAGAGAHDNLVPQVIVWHIIEDWSLASAFPPPNGAACGPDRNSVRVLRRMTAANDSIDLAWADGTPARMRVALRTTPMSTAESVTLDLIKLP